MAAPSARELADELEERRSAQFYVDAWRGRRTSYAEFHERLDDIIKVYNGDWSVIWPDGETTEALPKIFNALESSAKDRARVVASVTPSLRRRPDKPGDKPRAKADKVERIVGDWLRRSHVWGRSVQEWSLHLMAGGLMVCKVDMDTSMPRAERYPRFKVIHPARCFPSPTFAAGPGVDDMIVSYVEKIRTLKERFPEAEWKDFDADPNLDREEGTVVEYHDDQWSVVTLSAVNRGYNPNKTGKQFTLMEVRHGLGCTPFAIGTAPSMDGSYRGDFYGALGVLNFANRLRTLMLDDAIAKVYPERITYNVENPEAMGPGADIELQTQDARYEYAQSPNQPFSNLQIMRDLMGEIRAGVTLPPSRSGDPNESIISAAGIGAANSQFQLSAAAIQTDAVAPMVQEAIYIAAKWDVKYADTDKSITASNGSYVEDYKPSKDLPENCVVEVEYGTRAGLDPLNHGVMILQQWAGGEGLIDDLTALELSPLVDDAQRTYKARIKDRLQRAALAGLEMQAANGAITAQDIGNIAKMLDDDDKGLLEAVAQYMPQAPAPLAAPASTPGAAPEAPGLAGAAAPTNSLPPVEELFGAI